MDSMNRPLRTFVKGSRAVTPHDGGHPNDRELARQPLLPVTISPLRPRTIQLTWPGRGSNPSRLAATRPLRTFATPDGSLLLHGENLSALRTLAATHEGRVTLAYLDPPFFTNRIHEARVGHKDARTRLTAFDDRWPDQAAYLEAIAPRLAALRALLAPHGSIVIHVDTRTSHYVKVLADEIFGPDAFTSEIVWRYRRWPSKTPNFQRVHDVLLRYRKDTRTKPRWNQPYEPLAASTIATWGTTKQRAVFAASGRRERSSSTEEPTRGAPMGDVWDIGVIAPVSRERTGYPSQKPEALLERIVGALSDPGDIVLDPYAGSGTTLAVATRMGRAFVGIDQSPVAVDTALARLARAGVALSRERAETASSSHAPVELRIGSRGARR
jgi:DNA modification methylase